MKKYILSIFFFSCLASIVSCSDKSTSSDTDEEEKISYQIITDDLEIPWQMAFAPDGRIFISERTGLIKIVENDELHQAPWLDLRDSLKTPTSPTVVNSGIMGIALHPEFTSNRYVYIGYSYEAPGEEFDYNKLVRYIDNPETGKAEFDTVLLDKVKGLSMHNSAHIKFGPDNKLYWSNADRHEVDTAQDLEDLSGSILRINPDGNVPDDNPFAGSYIYAYGLRNSQSFDWHPDLGVMLATEHGPSGPQGCCLDEINIIEAGKNYGWPVIRGDEEALDMETPLIHSGEGSDRDKYTWAPSGATFIKSGLGRRSFLFAGLRSQSLWQIEFKTDGDALEIAALNRYLKGEFGRIRSVNQNDSGTIYILTSNLDQHEVPFNKDYLVRITFEN